MARPKIEFDLEEVYEFSKDYCSFIELSHMFNCSLTTIQDRYKHDPEFKSAVDRGRLEAIKGLRRKQLDMAMDGNTQMAIWLGKQILGQTDKQEIDQLSRVEPISIEIVNPDGSL
jgi:hypothetical protein